MAALLRAKVTTSDSISIKKTTTYKIAYMTLSEFENDYGQAVVKLFSDEFSAKAYADGEQVIEVQITRKMN